MMTRRSPRHRQQGFSLIEIIAAFLIFAIGFGVLLEILTGSLRMAKRSAEYTEATLYAESLLDQVGVGEVLKDGTEHGSFNDDYRWTLAISKIDPPAASMGVDRAETENPRRGIGAPLQPTPPPAANTAGLEQITGIDMYSIALTVHWGPRGRERQARFTTLRAIDSAQNEMRRMRAGARGSRR